MATFLTFDLGTTLYKVALFDDQGKLLALERAIPPIEHPRPQWAQVGAEAFVQVLRAAVGRLAAREDLSGVAALCIATQANTFLLEDKHGRALTPFILWSDQRAAELADEVRKVVPGASPLLAIAKLLWLQRHEPHLMKRAYRLTFIGDYLTDNQVTEAGVAALARIYDLRRPQAARECGHLILKELRLPDLELPNVFPAGYPIDVFFRAEQFGLPKDCQMVIGCLDQYAGAIGTGTVESGRMCETTGTVLAAVRCADRLRDNLPASVIQGPAFDPDRWWQMSFSSTSANLLEWYRNQLAGKPSFEELTAKAQATPESDLVIEPYDDRGPIESAFRQVRAEHTPGQVVRAIMHRVALSLKQQVEQLCGGEMPREIRSAGGAARNDLWMQMKADVLGVPMVAMECEEPTSLGAAMLAARGVGLGDVAELARKWARVRKRFEPR